MCSITMVPPGLGRHSCFHRNISRVINSGLAILIYFMLIPNAGLVFRIWDGRAGYPMELRPRFEKLPNAQRYKPEQAEADPGSESVEAGRAIKGIIMVSHVVFETPPPARMESFRTHLRGPYWEAKRDIICLSPSAPGGSGAQLACSLPTAAE